jgi:thiazole/oxazole-forming peptide maturase SagD family component
MSRDSTAASHSSEGLLRAAVLSGPVVSIAAEGSPILVAAARLQSMRPDDPTLRFASGWGASWAEAEQRCLLEAAERCSAQFFGTEPVERTTFAALRSAAVAPPELLLVDEAQYERRARWNRLHPGLNSLPVRWREHRPLDWLLCQHGLSSEPAWLPAGLCLLGHDKDRASGLAPADSSGVAAGKSIEDAAVRAFLELIERDAVAIWWYGRIARPQLELKALNEPLVWAYADWSRSRGRILRLLDLSHDFEIPVTAAIAHDAAGASIAFGFGAGRSMAEAGRHAVGELAQCESNLSLIEARVNAAGLRGLTPEARALFRWWRLARLSDQPHLVGYGRVQAKRGRVRPLSIQNARSMCRRRALRFLAIDLTRPGIGIPVARVVVPGLRPMWSRFAPGRLYDVPVALGWRRRRIARAALNPIPLMI